jgi:autotransporter-associated beta strand protein
MFFDAPNGKRPRRRAAMAALATATLTSSVLAQTSISYNSGNYTQNFNGMPNLAANSFSFANPGPFDISAAPISGTDIDGWSIGKTVGSAAGVIYKAENGGNFSGAVNSYGVFGETDRALGALASGSVTGAFGATFVNNSSTTYTQFVLSYTGEQWRRGNAAANTLTFAYQLGGSSILSAGFTNAPALNFTAPVTTGTSIALNGNDPANQTPIVAAVTGLNWAPGQTLVIRWTDVDDGGNDDGIAIDDLTFSASAPRSLIWNPPGTTWDTSAGNTNWLDGGSSVAFGAGDNANFTDAGLAAGSTVTVDAAGIAPSSVFVSNTSGTYTFNGGTISGLGGLVKTGGGALVINTVNTFNGTTINDGRVVIGNDNALGNPAIPLTLGGGTLAASADVTGSRGIALSSSTSTIDDGGFTVTYSGAITGAGSLRKAGTGTLVLAGPVGHSGDTLVEGGGTIVYAQPAGTAAIKNGGGGFDGNLVIANPIRLNVNEGVFGGSGKIYAKASGAQISSLGGGVTNFDVEIVANPDNLAAPFVMFFGGTGGHEINLARPISGNADINFASSPQGGGAATINLNAVMTYTGTTFINNGGPTPAGVGSMGGGTSGFPAGTLRLGVDDAFPVTTDVIANTIVLGAGSFNGPGRIEMNGRNQTFRSIATGNGSGNPNGFFEITNFGGNDSTLTINGDNTPATPFAGLLTDGPTNKLTLVKEGNGVLELTGVYPAIYTWQINLMDVPIKPWSGGTHVRGGTLIAPHLSHGPLSITGGEARVTVKTTANDPAGTTVVPSLTFGGTVAVPVGKLDLTNNSLIIDFVGGPGGLAGDIRQLIKAGVDSAGASGIVTSVGTSGQTGLGYGDNAVLMKTEFAGKTVDLDSTFIKFTYFGDADLNGQVDVADLGALASNWQTAGLWTAGDFDYSGFIDVADLGLLASNWQAGVGSPLGPSLAEALAAVGLPSAAVPEPGSVALLTIGSLALLRRRCVR